MNALFRPGLEGVCKSAPMMKPIRSIGAAVVALAAPALFTLPAAASTRSFARVETLLGSDTKLTLAIGSGYDDYHRGGGYRRGLKQYGQTDREVRELSRDAVKACRQAVRYEARQLGYRDVEIDDDVYIRQIGPRGFFVTLGEGDFEGRRRDVETRVLCQIGRGSVITVEGIPHPSKSQRYGRGW
ncbi:MAG: hypothetical protein GC196_15415 [Hyphomonas sp.]|nr:hypothetical protein [Hyphomonas sp.]